MQRINISAPAHGTGQTVHSAPQGNVAHMGGGFSLTVMTANQYAGVHEEFVRVLQGISTLYRFGSDRVNNADDYCRKHALAMAQFDSPEIHQDTCALYRKKAQAHL